MKTRDKFFIIIWSLFLLTAFNGSIHVKFDNIWNAIVFWIIFIFTLS